MPSPADADHVARNPAKRQWLLAIGPTISRAKPKEAPRPRGRPAVQALERQKGELTDKVAALEAESKRLQLEAQALEKTITDAIAEAVGPVEPFTATHDFQADEATDAELAACRRQISSTAPGEARGRREPRGNRPRLWGDMSLPWGY